MKKLLGLFSVILPLLATAQTNYCGTVQTESDLVWLRQSGHTEATGTSGGDVIYVPLKVHIVGTDEGTGYLSLGTLFQNICDLNDQFAETGFYFYIYEDIDYINNTEYYNHDWLGGAYLMSENNEDDLVNVYFVGDPAGNCGYYSPSGNAVAIANACGGVGNSTIAHELGHFFSLPHTFYGWEYGLPDIDDQEEVDGDNCNTAADGFCDTPPDYLADRWNCSSPPTFTDPDGVDFQPDGTYFMSYSNDECQTQFSPLQQEAMIDNINGPRNELLDYDPIDIVDVDSTNLVSPPDFAIDQYSNYTPVIWESVPGAIGYELSVSLTSSFTAITVSLFTTDTSAILTTLSPEKTYRWRVKVIGSGNTCEGYSTYRTFETGAQTLNVGLNDLSKENDIFIYPNPIIAGGNLQVQMNESVSGNMQFMLYDLAGRQIESESVLVNGGLAGLRIPQIAPGVYTLNIQSDGFQYNTTLVIQ
jgi:hypothetical protein